MAIWLQHRVSHERVAFSQRFSKLYPWLPKKENVVLNVRKQRHCVDSRW